MLNRVLRPTNTRVRLYVGLLLAGLFAIQCTSTEASKKSSDLVSVVGGKQIGTNSPQVEKQVEDLARTNHIALLEMCAKNYDGRFYDFTCTFVKQERIHGSLRPEQTIDVKFLGKPYSVAMVWTKNAPIGDRMLYVQGKYNNMMLVHPKGMLGGLVGSVLRAPDGEEAMQNTLRPVSQFGFQKLLGSLLDVYNLAKRNGDLKTEFGGNVEVAGRPAVALVRYLPNKPGYPSKKAIVYIDKTFLVPIGLESYDWEDQLSSRYIYKDIKFNVGLKTDDFAPEANGMKEPK